MDCFAAQGREFEINSDSDINFMSWQKGGYNYILCGCCCFEKLAELASSII